jgi:hypothetical protein
MNTDPICFIQGNTVSDWRKGSLADARKFSRQDKRS